MKTLLCLRVRAHFYQVDSRGKADRQRELSLR